MSHDQLQATPEQIKGMSVIRAGLIELDAARPFQFPLQPGEQLRPLSQVMETTAARITQATPVITLDLARAVAWGAQSMLNDEQRSTLATADAQTLAEVMQTRDLEISQLGNAIEQQESSIVLEPGVLAIPPYRQQEGEKTCMGATFLSMFEGLTGISISEQQFIQIARETGFMTDLDSVSEEVMALFMTNAFRGEFPNMNITVFTAGGFDFAQLKAKVAEVKQEAAFLGRTAEVYFLPTLKSEVMQDRNIFHITTLLAADGNSVILHDPSGVVGGQFKPVHRHDFMQRWSQGLFRGKLIVVNK